MVWETNGAGPVRLGAVDRPARITRIPVVIIPSGDGIETKSGIATSACGEAWPCAF